MVCDRDIIAELARLTPEDRLRRNDVVVAALSDAACSGTCMDFVLVAPGEDQIRGSLEIGLGGRRVCVVPIDAVTISAES